MNAIRHRFLWGTLRAGLVVLVLMSAGCGGNQTVSYDDQVERAVGQVLGEQVAAAVPGGGKLVVLIQRGAGALEDQRNQAYLDGLAEGFDATSFQITEAGPDLGEIKAEHQATVMHAVTKGWPAMAYLGWCRAEPDAVAVVSFIEFPARLNTRSLGKVPPLFVFSNTGADMLRSLATQGKVRYAIVPGGTGTQPSAKASAADIVATRYESLPN